MAQSKRSFSGIIKLAWSAVKGEQADIMGGSMDRAILLLSVPMVLEMLMESLFAVVDIYFVAKVNVDAVAIVGLTESMLTIVYSVAWGLAMGVSAMVARRVGEKDIKGAAVASVQGIYIGLFIAFVVSLIGLFFSADLLRLMGASEQVIAQGTRFTTIMLGGNFAIMLLFLINGIFRGAGDATIAMRSLWLANGINILLDPLFIFGIGPFPEMGVDGAAIATTTGRTIGVCYQLYHLFKGKGQIKIHRDNWQFNKDIIFKLIKVSSGGTGQFIIASSSWIFLMRIMSTFGSIALAGYTVAIRIVMFTLLPAWGMANASATMVGQNLGANQPERAEKAVWRTGFFNMIFMGSVMIIFLFFAGPIIRFFTQDEEVIMHARNCLNIMSLGYLFYAYGMVIVQSFNGAGDTRTPTLLNVVIFWLIQIPLAYLLTMQFSFGPSGIFWAIVSSESLLTIIAFWLFKRGKWKHTKI